MSVYQKLSSWVVEKLNPAQERIAQAEGLYVTTNSKISYTDAFEKIDVVNRSVNMVVSAASSLDYDVKDKVNDGVVVGVRQKSLANLLNFRPNPYQSAQEFRSAIFTDLIVEGNVFIHFDGTFMYHLPAANVDILTDTKTFIRGYRYRGLVEFPEADVFHFRDLNPKSVYRGSSRLQSAQKSINVLYSMQEFQENFFDNGAMFGTVLTTDNTLSQVAKEKTIAYWTQLYNVRKGGRRPVILDSGLKPSPIASSSFTEMEFDQGIKTHSEKIMQVIGVPPILLAGGNNANIAPNLRLFYLETVLPLTRKFASALERYFGYDIEPVTASVSALQPELKDWAGYLTTLVNGGVITPNEARVELRKEKIKGHDDLRIPANIAGSAVDPSQGGRPPSKQE